MLSFIKKIIDFILTALGLLIFGGLFLTFVFKIFGFGYGILIIAVIVILIYIKDQNDKIQFRNKRDREERERLERQAKNNVHLWDKKKKEMSSVNFNGSQSAFSETK